MAVPVISPGFEGVSGLTITGKVLAELVPQEFVAVTVMFPFCPASPTFTVIELVVLPAGLRFHPVGTVQV